MAMAIDITAWTAAYLQAVRSAFGTRVLFVGLQGSHGRGEAGAASDIDMVLILDELFPRDLATYRAAVAGLPHRDHLCGFVSGRRELASWSRADLFQFCHDTTPLLGDLSALLPESRAEDARQAVLVGACNTYHLCVHNSVHARDLAVLRSLYKGAVFVIQALHCHRTGVHIRRHRDLVAAVGPEERRVLLMHESLKAVEAGEAAAFDEASGLLLEWSGRLIREYGSAAG